MNETPRFDAETLRGWLRREIEIRVPRLWVVVGGLAVAILALVALD